VPAVPFHAPVSANGGTVKAKEVLLPLQLVLLLLEFVANAISVKGSKGFVGVSAFLRPCMLMDVNCGKVPRDMSNTVWGAREK
jgi:hypothetical protein